MTLRIHSGIVRVESWRPGSKGAGDTAKYDVGDFAEDVILVGIIRDPDSDTGDPDITATLTAPSPSGKRAILDALPTDTVLFDGGLQGGGIELNIPIPAQTKFKFELKWAGTAAVGLLFLFGAPVISYDQFAALTERAASVTRDKPRRI